MNATGGRHLALISVHGDPAVDIGGEEAGGQNVYVRQVGEALAQQGWQVEMFSRKADPEQPEVVTHQPNCRTIRLQAGPEAFVPRQDIFGYCEDFLQQLQAFARAQGIAYELIHSNYWLSGWVGLALKQRYGLPLVHTYHSLGSVKYQAVEDVPPIASQRLQVEKACLETADRVVATSPQEQAHMRALVSSAGSIEVIPCGTDIQHFGSIDDRAARERLGIAPEAYVIFYIGRFDRRKGIETLVRAVAQSQLRARGAPLQLILAGGADANKPDSEERRRIGDLVSELGLADCTQFPGRVPDAELPAYYAAADVCVVPSHYEPFGLVPIEAMASGTPVVGSNVGGLQFTVVPEETGLLVPPQAVEAFSQAIDRVLGNPEWRRQLGANARQRVVDRFSWSGVAAQLGDLYERVIAEAASRAPVGA